MKHGDILKNIITVYNKYAKSKKTIAEIASLLDISKVRLGRILNNKRSTIYEKILRSKDISLPYTCLDCGDI